MTSIVGTKTRLEHGSRRPYYPALDGLRAISVILVISHHAKGPFGFFNYIPGWLGVDVFFVLSGFLITMLLLKEYKANNRVDFQAFYLRRIFRILPVYFVVLSVYIILNKHRGGEGWQLLKASLPFYLTFLNEFAHAPFDFTWTLGIEEKFYIFWPVLCFNLFPRRRAVMMAIVYFLLLCCLYRYSSFSRSYSGLLVGCALAVALESTWGPGIRARIEQFPTIVPVFLAITCAELCRLYANAVFFFDFSILLLVAHLVVKPSFTASLLSSRAATWIGRRSYSMYLIHGLVLGFLELHLPQDTVFQHTLLVVAASAVALGIAELLFLTVEEPARRFGKRVIAARSLVKVG